MKKFFVVLVLNFIFSAAQANVCINMFSKTSSDYLRALEPLQTQELQMEPLNYVERNDAFKTNLQGTNYLSSLIRHASQVADFIEANVPPRLVRTVVYPASGYDAATAFLIFPQATTVIGIEHLPFVKSNSSSIPTHLPLDQQPSMARKSDVNDYARDNDMVSAIVGRLSESIPNFHLLKVVAAISEGGVNGWVEFDTGPGTLIRRYIHVDSEIPTASAWLESAMGTGFEGLLIKGGVNMSHPTERDLLVQQMRVRGGIAVDSDWALPESTAASNPPGVRVFATQIPLGFKMAKVIRFHS